MSCRLPGCNYSTTSQLPAEVEHYLHWQLLDYHFKAGHVPKDKIVKSELAIKPDDVSTSVASSDDEQILAPQLVRSKCDEDPAVGNNATCRHCLGEAHGPDDKKTRKLLCPAWGFQCDKCRRDRIQLGKIYAKV